MLSAAAHACASTGSRRLIALVAAVIGVSDVVMSERQRMWQHKEPTLQVRLSCALLRISGG